MAYAYYDADLTPPEAFPALVRHVHIHDVFFTEMPSDHRPIGHGDAPLADFVASLLNAGYTGAFTMEYAPQEMFNEEYAIFLKDSKEALLKLIEQVQPVS
jgi:sugar phosphate isomerase/epimerase